MFQKDDSYNFDREHVKHAETGEPVSNVLIPTLICEINSKLPHVDNTLQACIKYIFGALQFKHWHVMTLLCCVVDYFLV